MQENASITYIPMQDTSYPLSLKKITNPPVGLYVKGNLSLLFSDGDCLAVVGSRAMTGYGRSLTETFTKALVAKGYGIVSGLALGVDAVAHQTALDEGGKTIAVLGCGVDCCYPKGNTMLYERILKNGGVIVSEIPPGIPPRPGFLAARNRIIVGLSKGVVITQAAEKSGTLITADFAVANKRNVFAAFGHRDTASVKGYHILMKKGAVSVSNPTDIDRALNV